MDKKPIPAQPILGHIKEHKLTLCNAPYELQKVFGEEYTKKYVDPFRLSFGGVLIKMTETKPEIQIYILELMGIHSREEQDDFCTTPLLQALEQYAAGFYTPPLLLANISLQKRLLLNPQQFTCLKEVVVKSSTLHDANTHVDENDYTPIHFSALINAEDKRTLLSLPPAFTQDKDVIDILDELIVAEDSPTVSKIVNTPLAMFFYGLRIPFCRNEAGLYEVLKTLLPSRIGCCFIAMVTNGLLYKKNPFVFTIASTISLSGMLQSLCVGFDRYYVDGNPQCIIPSTTHKFKNSAMSFGVVPLFLQLLNTQFPSPERLPVFSVMPCTLALGIMFALWDLYKYGPPKHAVKTQLITQLIEEHKKQRPQQQPSCALL